MPHLFDVHAKHRWISLKPFIGEVNPDDYLAEGILEWVPAGGLVNDSEDGTNDTI